LFQRFIIKQLKSCIKKIFLNKKITGSFAKRAMRVGKKKKVWGEKCPRNYALAEYRKEKFLFFWLKKFLGWAIKKC